MYTDDMLGVPWFGGSYWVLFYERTLSQGLQEFRLVPRRNTKASCSVGVRLRLRAAGPPDVDSPLRNVSSDSVLMLASRKDQNKPKYWGGMALSTWVPDSFSYTPTVWLSCILDGTP